MKIFLVLYLFGHVAACLGMGSMSSCAAAMPAVFAPYEQAWAAGRAVKLDGVTVTRKDIKAHCIVTDGPAPVIEVGPAEIVRIA